MTKAELKPCPFCGGEVKIKSDCKNYIHSFYWITCNECGTRQMPSIHKEAVIESWNRRV
jgi:Lar family restriction alleviation protein